MNLAQTRTDEPPPDLTILSDEDVDQLRLGWWSKLDSSDVRRVLAAAPGLSIWMPSTCEYILVGPWRHRQEIVHIMELVSIRNTVDLAKRSIEQAAATNTRLYIAVEMTERRQVSFYDRIGMTILEDVLAYELIPDSGARQVIPDLDVERITKLDDASMRVLQDIDWDAFPWLWRNSRDEFIDYAMQPGVEIHLLRDGGEPVGYVGFTCFPGWGHIDRVAVKSTMQGKGLGVALTRFATGKLARMGAAKIGLSTQRRNERSQRLYSGLGFRRQESGDYRIYGLALDETDDLHELVTGEIR